MSVASSSVLLVALHIRLSVPRESTFDSLVSVEKKGARVWMLGLTLQGNGDSQLDCVDCGVSVFIGASVYAEGTNVTCMNGMHVYCVDWSFCVHWCTCLR